LLFLLLLSFGTDIDKGPNAFCCCYGSYCWTCASSYSGCSPTVDHCVAITPIARPTTTIYVGSAFGAVFFVVIFVVAFIWYRRRFSHSYETVSITHVDDHYDHHHHHHGHSPVVTHVVQQPTQGYTTANPNYGYQQGVTEYK